jgi:protein SCO1/2
MHPRRVVLALSLLPALAAGCAGSARDAATNFRGVVLSPAIEKPDVALTDFNGRPWNLRLETAGKVTLLFFGYTHCPDVCPLHAANVAAVLRQLPFAERDEIRFVFVTTDPARDTPQRLREWLGGFDPTFIGLTGPAEEVSRIQAGLRMAPAQLDPSARDSTSYLVGHSAQVLAFGKDGLARLEYPFGVRQEDWANDLPRLARGEVPPEPAMEAAVTAEPPPTIGVETPIMPRPSSTAEASVYVTLRGLAPDDTLVAMWSPAAQGVAAHESHQMNGTIRMMPVERLVVPADGTLRFAPGAMHLMVTALREIPAVGHSIPISLRFARRGDLVFAATVVEYADVQRLLAPTAR